MVTLRRKMATEHRIRAIGERRSDGDVLKG
jgi:hypothetical protein